MAFIPWAIYFIMLSSVFGGKLLSDRNFENGGVNWATLYSTICISHSKHCYDIPAYQGDMFVLFTSYEYGYLSQRIENEYPGDYIVSVYVLSHQTESSNGNWSLKIKLGDEQVDILNSNNNYTLDEYSLYTAEFKNVKSGQLDLKFIHDPQITACTYLALDSVKLDFTPLFWSKWKVLIISIISLGVLSMIVVVALIFSRRHRRNMDEDRINLYMSDQDYIG